MRTEQIARIIDPEAWDDWTDQQIAYCAKHGLRDGITPRRNNALTQAAAIEDMLSASPLAYSREGEGSSRSQPSRKLVMDGDHITNFRDDLHPLPEWSAEIRAGFLQASVAKSAAGDASHLTASETPCKSDVALNEEGEVYTAAQLMTLLKSRDDFLVSKGLFGEYADSLPAKGITTVETPCKSAWRQIESAPLKGPFLAINKRGDIRKCWRHHPSSRTDEILTWGTNGKFKSVGWLPCDVLPGIPPQETSDD